MSLSTERIEIAIAQQRRRESSGELPALVAVPILVALSSLLYLGTAGRPALLDGDVDAAHALVVREMLQRRDYVVMFMDGIRYLIRPPLQFWLTGVSYGLFGQTAFATRLPVALAMISLVLLVYEFGRRFFGGRAGFYAALVVCTSGGMFIFTRVMIPEAIYAVEFTLFYYLFIRAWTGTLNTRIGYWGAAVCAGLAMLTRGPIGVIFPVGGVAVFLTVTRAWRRWKELRPFSSSAVFLAVAAPWHILAAIRAPGFLWQYFVNENFHRAMGTRVPHDYIAVPLWAWWPEHLLWLFPWSAFLLLAFQECPPLRQWRNAVSRSVQARLLLVAWAGFILLFFSVEHGSRMEYYSFGAWPAIALLLGGGLARAEKTPSRLLLGSQRLLTVLGVFASSLLILLAAWPLAVRQNLSATLRNSGPTGLYRYSMAPLLDFTWQTFAKLHAPMLLAGFSVLLSLLTAWFLRKRRRHLASNLAIALGMAGFFFAANMAYASFEPEFSSKALAQTIDEDARPGAQIVVYGDIRVAASVGFYTGRRLLLYRATESNLEYGSHYPDAPKTFLDDGDFESIWNQTRQVFLVVPDEDARDALRSLPQNRVWRAAANGGKTVYANLPNGPTQFPLSAAR